MSTYQDIYQHSLTNPEGFWTEATQGIDWIKPWDNVIDNEAKPVSKWFVCTKINTCYNCLDRHVENGLGGQDALIYDSPVTDTKYRYTYSQLTQKVAKFAGLLRDNASNDR